MYGNDSHDQAEIPNDGQNDTGGTANRAGALSAITRRRVLATSGTAAAGLTAFTGTASAHVVDTVAFCGCTQVTVYGEELGDTSYQAVLYCDGDIVRRDLTGTETRQNYDMDADETIGPGDDCQIIALEGTTSPHGSFTICNNHCPANCARKGLDDADLECSVPDGITVQCSGCGRDEPGHPGGGGGRGRRRGR